MNFKQFSTSDNQWHDIPYYQHKTATDALTLPAVIYPNDTSITVGIKGQSSQSGTPDPSQPCDVNGTGERTGNLFTGDYSQFDNAGGTGTTYAYFKLDTDACLTVVAKSTVTVPENFYLGLTKSGGNPSGGTRWILKPNNTFSAGQIVTIKTSQDGYYFVSMYQKSSSVLGWIQANFDIMLNEGSTALHYEPYGYKIPILCGNQTTNIYLGETQSIRAVKKLVLTGEENWEQQSGQTADYFRISNMAALPSKVFCTHYISPDDDINYASTVTGIKMQQSSSYGVILACRPPNVTGLANFKSFLATQYANGTPVTVWYVLATPETVTINEPLMKIGDYADSLTTSIPVTAGENTLDVQTTVQPSEVVATFEGWHPVQSVHERENGQWD